MKKLFLLATLAAALPVLAQTEAAAPQTPPTEAAQPEKPRETPAIAGMIEACEHFYNSMAGLFGGTPDPKADISHISIINFPRTAPVIYLAQTSKISKAHQKAVAGWFKEYGQKPEDKKLYNFETIVTEGDKNYTLICRDVALPPLAKLKAGDAVTLDVRILGFTRKKGVTDYFLLCDGVQ